MRSNCAYLSAPGVLAHPAIPAIKSNINDMFSGDAFESSHLRVRRNDEAHVKQQPHR
jgi:hypothetical protein